MSDPISVTGTVIGIVSLGLSLCQGLVDYLGALKCRREEIESTYQQINGLQSSFSVIKAVLPKLRMDYQASGQVVRNHLRLCEDEINRLTQLLDEFKHHDSPSGSLNMRVQFQAKKLLYPFRQGNIHRLESGVRKLNGILLVALQSLQLNLCDTQVEKLSLLTTASESTSTIVASTLENALAISSDLKSLESGLREDRGHILSLSSVVEQCLPVIQHKVSMIAPQVRYALPKIELYTAKTAIETSNICRTLNVINEDVGSVRKELDSSLKAQNQQIEIMQALLSGMNQLQSQQTSRTKNLENEIRNLQLRLILKPGALKSFCDELKDLDSAEGLKPYKRRRNRAQLCYPRGDKEPQESFCFCLRRSSLISRHCHSRAVSLFFNKSTYENHVPECEFYVPPQQTHTLGASFRRISYFINVAIMTTMSIKTGAGGMSISPSISFRMVVPSSSPAFALFSPETFSKALESELVSTKRRYHETLEHTTQRLLEIFADRQAFPTDLNEYGESLLQVALRSIGLECFVDLNTQPGFRKFLLGLCVASVPLDTVNSFGRSPLDFWVSSLFYTRGCADKISTMADIASELIDYGADSCTKIHHHWRHRRIPDIIPCFLKLSELAELCQCGQLSMAVLQRSDKDVNRILTKFPSSLNEQNIFGQTPLHLSCGWPPGMELLLDYGAYSIIDHIDDFGFTAFVYASYHGCLESLEILLEAGSCLFPLNPSEPYRRITFCFTEAFSGSSEAIRGRLVEALVARRVCLRELALGNLPPDEARDFSLFSDTILDEKSHDVCLALKARKINIPEALAVPIRSSVYHFKSLSLECAQRLYDIGFKDVEIFDEDGLTPLMSNLRPKYSIPTDYDEAINSLKLKAWLISKGANLYVTAKSPQGSGVNPNATAAHFLGSKIGEFDAKGVFWGGYPPYDPIVSSLCTTLCSISALDVCCCGCSSIGCSPITMVFKGYIKFRFDKKGIITLVCWLVENHITAQASQRVFAEMIRFMTFDRMGIKHTCCQTDWGFRIRLQDEEEMKEIREEESFRLRLLEDLVNEFETRYSESRELLMDFFKGYWEERMEQVQSELEPVNEEEISKIEAIGVVLDRAGVGL